MSKSGRYGKYGEIKRIQRLRQAGNRGGTTPEEQPAHGPSFLRRERAEKEPVSVRPGRASDADFIRDLSGSAFTRYGPYQDLLPEWFEMGLVAALVALSGKKRLGFAMWGYLPPRAGAPRAFELVAIAVEKKWQGKGVGTLLLEAVVAAVKDLKGNLLLLHTATDNFVAQRLFDRHGFAPTFVRKQFYPNGQDALQMAKHLSPPGG